MSALRSWAVGAALALGMAAHGSGQEPAKPSRQRPQEEQDFTLQLKGKVELLALVQLFSRSLNLRVIFDSSLLEGKEVSIAGPDKVSRKELEELLEAALAAKGLALEQDERSGWLRVVPTAQARREIRIYRPVNGDATDLAMAARSVFGMPMGMAPGAPPQGAPQAPGMGMVAEVGITLDAATNSIIVEARPEKLGAVMDFLKQIDRKRLQVLVEIVIVSADLSDQLSYGVEAWQRREKNGEPERFLAQLFGLSTVDSALNVEPGITSGFNGVILKPRDYAFAIRALQSTTKAQILATPRLLVRDNAEAEIKSIQEHPFVSINATQTVATTSFAGFETAGSILKIKPKVTEGESLHLDYTITLSNFTAPPPSPESPPPRKTDQLTSSVVIPDGYTVLVGGLQFELEQEQESKLPILGDIPFLGEAFKSTTKSKTVSRLFVFIRAQIIRDDHFLDLKNVSSRELRKAELEGLELRPNSVRVMRR